MQHLLIRPIAVILLSLCILFPTSLPAQSTPSLAGAWTSAGRPTSITQDAAGRLLFTNENGLRSNGTFANQSTVIATDWEGGLRGALQDNGNTIRWANGTAWFRAARPSLAGAWTSAGRPTSITQDAGRLLFTNENGLRSNGTFANQSTVIATDWEGGLRGALQDSGNTIRWANGTAWFRAASASSSPAPQPPARSLTGIWRIWANTAGEGKALRWQLTQVGNRLHGTMLGSGQSIDGTVNGRAVELRRSGGGLAVPQVYQGFLFEAGAPPTMAGTFSHKNERSYSWYGWLEN